MTNRSAIPLTRANLTYSLSSTSSMLERARRTYPAIPAQVNTKVGKIKWEIPPRP